MNWKTLALAGTATFAVMTANAAFAQNGTTDTAPAATTNTTTTDTDMKAPAATDSSATDAAAKPAKPAKKHRKHKMKAAMSQSQEEQTTADLNRQQAENPGSAPSTSGSGMSTTTSSSSSSDMNATTPSSSSGNDGMDNSGNAQKPLMGGQESTGTTPAPADHGNTANPAAQSDKMGNGDMNSGDMKTDMHKDMKKKMDDATTPPPTTNPMP